MYFIIKNKENKNEEIKYKQKIILFLKIKLLKNIKNNK